jgi:hypothetical protein
MLNKGWTYLDFRKKEVFVFNGKKGKNDWCDCVPATIKEHKAFMANFYNKGILICSFKELQTFVKFHGVKKRGRVYHTIFITDRYCFENLLAIDFDIEKSVSSVFNDYFYVKQKKKNNESFEKLSKKLVVNFVKQLEKAVDEYFKEQ